MGLEARGLERWAVLAVYAVLGAAVLAPVLSVQVPCLGDYLNHLARISILSKIGGTPGLQAFYDPHWKFVPYYGMDVPVLALARVMPIYDAGRIFVALCVVLPVAAVAVLRYALLRRVGLMPAFMFLFCYNHLLERGFLTYLFSVSLAVMVFAGWIASARMGRVWRTALFAVALVLLYLCHAFAFLTYCILVAGYEVGASFRRRAGVRAAVGEWARAALPAAPALVLGAVSGGNDNVSAAAYNHYGSALDKLGAVLSPLYFPGDPFVLPTLAFLCAVAALGARRMVFVRESWPAAVAVALAGAATPSVLFNAWGSDFRLPLVLVMVLIAACTARRRIGRGAVLGVLAILAVLVGARAGAAWVLLHRLDRQVASVREVVAALPRFSRLLIVDAQTEGGGRVAPSEMTGHIGLVAAIDRDAFVPFLFLGNTPILVRPALAHSSSRLSVPVDLRQLRAGLAARDPAGGPPPFGWGGQVYWLGWPAKFDDVLVMHFGTPLGALPGNLRIVRGGDVADLYRIVPRAE